MINIFKTPGEEERTGPGRFKLKNYPDHTRKHTWDQRGDLGKSLAKIFWAWTDTAAACQFFLQLVEVLLNPDLGWLRHLAERPALQASAPQNPQVETVCISINLSGLFLIF